MIFSIDYIKKFLSYFRLYPEDRTWDNYIFQNLAEGNYDIIREKIKELDQPDYDIVLQTTAKYSSEYGRINSEVRFLYNQLKQQKLSKKKFLEAIKESKYPDIMIHLYKNKKNLHPQDYIDAIWEHLKQKHNIEYSDNYDFIH